MPHAATSLLTPQTAFEAHLEAWRTAGTATDFSFVHDAAVYEFPFDPNPAARRVMGKAAIMALVRTVPLLGEGWEFHGHTYYPGADPQTVTVQFRGSTTARYTGRRYEQHYISLVQMCEGQIIHYWEYWNPDNLRAAF